MPDIMVLFACLSQCLDRTTIRRLCRVAEAMLSMTGRVTMRGMARWADTGGSYRTLQRFFTTSLSWGTLQWVLIRHHLFEHDDVLVMGGDEVVGTKSGKQIYGLDRFFSSLYGKRVPGLCFLSLSLMSVKRRTSYPVIMEQIEPKHTANPPEAPQKPSAGKRGRPQGRKNRHRRDVVLTPYLRFVQETINSLLKLIVEHVKVRYLVYDGAFGHNDALQMVKQLDLHLISKRAHDGRDSHVQKAEDGLQKSQALDRQPHLSGPVRQQAEVRQEEVRRWEAIQHEYRQRLEALSLTLHPFAIDGSAPQTSAQVEHRLHIQTEAMEAFAHTQQLPNRQMAMHKVKKQLPAFTALVDFWWAGVRQGLESAAVSHLWWPWAQETLLPKVYWEHQVTRTRCTRREAKMQQALEIVSSAFATHALTRCLPPQAFGDWYAWATRQVQAFQRASSAVEGRNGSLAQMHHNQRGLPKRRYKVWTVLYNFDCRASDATTPASRFFRWEFPDLFETLLSTIDEVPRPRKRHQDMALSP